MKKKNLKECLAILDKHMLSFLVAQQEIYEKKRSESNTLEAIIESSRVIALDVAVENYVKVYRPCLEYIFKITHD